MKLVRRLTGYLLAAVALVLAIDTWSSVRSHLGLFDDDMRRDDARLARALALAVDREWALGGEAAARLLVESLNVESDGLRLRIVPLAGIRGARLGLGANHPTSDLVSEGNQKRLLTYAALGIPASSPLVLEISESFAHERAYALARVRQAIETTLATVLACGFIAWMVGIRVVGRPIEALVAKARRIARGDFGEPLTLRPETELAMLAREMNDMAANLDAASREIAQQSAARIAAQEQLRHADRLTTVGKLASGLAHELGTPLGVVSGRAKMIVTGEATDATDVKECARVIVAQADRMTALVRELLGFARRRSGEKRRIALSGLVAQTAALLQPLGAKRGVEVITEGIDDGVTVLGDAPQIQQALMNLVMNAIQASSAGSRVRIAVHANAIDAPDHARKRGPFATIEVMDSGAGIAPELLEQVFDPFFTTKAPGEGTGLGLSVAYGIVQDHGGFIDVQSEPKRGSRFRIGLPRVAT
jgi:signal transduction histidine kinase